MRKLDRALGSTPAALLAGDSALEANFDLTDAGTPAMASTSSRRSPRSPDTGFERVRIGFAGNLPRDHGAQGHLRQRHDAHVRPFDRNSAQDAAQFRFVPPKGADIVGEDK